MPSKRKLLASKAAHYYKFVEWSEEDQCFIGRCPTLFSGGVHGNDESKVYAELRDVCDEWTRLLDQRANT